MHNTPTATTASQACVPGILAGASHRAGTQAWLAVVAVGVLCTGVAYVLYFKLIEQAGPARALAVTFVVPVFALIYGALFLGEGVTGWMLLCAGVIVIGTALSTGLLKLPAARTAPQQR